MRVGQDVEYIGRGQASNITGPQKVKVCGEGGTVFNLLVDPMLLGVTTGFQFRSESAMPERRACRTWEAFIYIYIFGNHDRASRQGVYSHTP